MSDMDFLKAVEFVRKAGTEEEKERLECILEGRKPEARFLKSLRRLQNVDGGFPLLMEKGKPSTLMDSAVVLVRLEEFNSLKTDIADRIINFFFARQNKDGSWNEDENLIPHNPPPWMNPKDIRVKILSTAYTGFWLAKLGYSQDMRIKKACDFLIKYQKKNGAFEGFKHTTWIAASLFAMVYGKECNITNMCLKFLTQIPKDQWVASQTAWLLWSLTSANFKKDSKFVRHFLDALAESQNSNGSFTSEDGKELSVSATLEVVKVLKYLK
jgi:hypothetical protein